MIKCLLNSFLEEFIGIPYWVGVGDTCGIQKEQILRKSSEKSRWDIDTT